MGRCGHEGSLELEEVKEDELLYPRDVQGKRNVWTGGTAKCISSPVCWMFSVF